MRTVIKGYLCFLGNDTYCCHRWKDISNIWEAAKVMGKFHVSQRMTLHQCGEWVMFVSIKCKCKSPQLGVEPSSPAWQRGILATILWWNQINWYYEIYFKYTIIYSIINIPSAIATSLRNYRYLYCAHVRSILVRRECFGHCTKCFVVLLVIQGCSSRW